MDLSALYAADFAVVDDLVTVTLRRQSDAYAAAQTVGNVLAGPVARREVETADAILEEVTRGFNVWRTNLEDELGGVTPPLKGDRLELPDGTVWRLTEVHTVDHGQRYRCESLREWA